MHNGLLKGVGSVGLSPPCESAVACCLVVGCFSSKVSLRDRFRKRQPAGELGTLVCSPSTISRSKFGVIMQRAYRGFTSTADTLATSPLGALPRVITNQPVLARLQSLIPNRANHPSRRLRPRGTRLPHRLFCCRPHPVGQSQRTCPGKHASRGCENRSHS
jgi:hypothetical protein